MPTEFLRKISEVIHKQYHLSTSGSVKLQDSTSNIITIKKSGGLLLFNFDKKNQKLLPFFNNNIVGLCKISDYTIIYPFENDVFIFIVELKTNNTTNSIEQIRAGFEFSKYICSSTNRLLKYRKNNIKFRGLVFSNCAITKGNTKPKNLGYQKDTYIKDLEFMHVRSGTDINLDNFTF